MRIARVRTGGDGITHFDEVEIPLSDAGEIGRLSETFPATGVVFRENDPDYDFDWHPAPRRQFVVLLDGAIEIEVGDGEVRRFAGGDVVLLEDTEGRGHRRPGVGRRGGGHPLRPGGGARALSLRACRVGVAQVHLRPADLKRPDLQRGTEREGQERRTGTARSPFGAS